MEEAWRQTTAIITEWTRFVHRQYSLQAVMTTNFDYRLTADADDFAAVNAVPSLYPYRGKYRILCTHQVSYWQHVDYSNEFFLNIFIRINIAFKVLTKSDNTINITQKKKIKYLHSFRHSKFSLVSDSHEFSFKMPISMQTIQWNILPTI